MCHIFEITDVATTRAFLDPLELLSAYDKGISRPFGISDVATTRAFQDPLQMGNIRAVQSLVSRQYSFPNKWDYNNALPRETQ